MAPVLHLLAALVTFTSATTGTAIARDYAHISRNRESFPIAQHVLQRIPTKTTPFVLATFHDSSPDRTLSKRGNPEDIPFVDDPIPTLTPALAEASKEEEDPFVSELKAKLAREEEQVVSDLEWKTGFLESAYKKLIFPYTTNGFPPPFKLEHHNNFDQILVKLSLSIRDAFHTASRATLEEEWKLRGIAVKEAHVESSDQLSEEEREKMEREVRETRPWLLGSLGKIRRATMEAFSIAGKMVSDEMRERERDLDRFGLCGWKFDSCRDSTVATGGIPTDE